MPGCGRLLYVSILLVSRGWRIDKASMDTCGVRRWPIHPYLIYCKEETLREHSRSTMLMAGGLRGRGGDVEHEQDLPVLPGMDVLS